MKKVKVLQGLPGSGKSTIAKNLVRENGDFVRVNKDDLRNMLYGGVWKPEREQGVLETERNIAEYFLVHEHKSVIVDDTNLNPRVIAFWKDAVEKWRGKGLTDLELEFDMVDTDVYTCVERDIERGTNGGVSVGRHVIYQMALEHELMDSDIHYILCDIDGTIADLEHRRKYVREQPKNWKKFYDEMGKDTLREEVWAKVEATAMQAHEAGKRAYVFLVSARPENYRAETEAWLERVGVRDYTALIMRRAGDSREDSIVKREILHKYFKDKSKIIKVFDDRPRVIRMWREEGLEVEDVGDGIEF